MRGQKVLILSGDWEYTGSVIDGVHQLMLECQGERPARPEPARIFDVIGGVGVGGTVAALLLGRFGMSASQAGREVMRFIAAQQADSSFWSKISGTGRTELWDRLVDTVLFYTRDGNTPLRDDRSVKVRSA